MTSCDEVRAVLAHFDRCEGTPDGARIATHCLYPSFAPVNVFIAKLGDGYKVHDGAEAYNTAWLHGRNDAVIGNALREECARFHLELSDQTIFASAPTLEWLASAIVSVANASATAATAAVARIQAVAEEALFEKIERVLKGSFDIAQIKTNIEVIGKSGGKRRFDFSVHSIDAGTDLLISGVAPHPGSVSSKYVAFADTDIQPSHKLAVYDRPLSTDDVALLQQVGSIVPLTGLGLGAQLAITR